MPVGGRTPPSVPEQLATPFLATATLPKNMGTGVRPVHNLLFVPNFAKPGRNQQVIYLTTKKKKKKNPVPQTPSPRGGWPNF